MVLLVNNLGATTQLEMGVAAREAVHIATGPAMQARPPGSACASGATWPLGRAGAGAPPLAPCIR